MVLVQQQWIWEETPTVGYKKESFDQQIIYINFIQYLRLTKNTMLSNLTKTQPKILVYLIFLHAITGHMNLLHVCKKSRCLPYLSTIYNMVTVVVYWFVALATMVDKVFTMTNLSHDLYNILINVMWNWMVALEAAIMAWNSIKQKPIQNLVKTLENFLCGSTCQGWHSYGKRSVFSVVIPLVMCLMLTISYVALYIILMASLDKKDMIGFAKSYFGWYREYHGQALGLLLLYTFDISYYISLINAWINITTISITVYFLCQEFHQIKM